MVSELYFLCHPILVHLGILIPNVPLGDGGGETCSGIVAEIVWVELDWLSIGARTSHGLVLKNPYISKLDDKLLHVGILHP